MLYKQLKMNKNQLKKKERNFRNYFTNKLIKINIYTKFCIKLNC